MDNPKNKNNALANLWSVSNSIRGKAIILILLPFLFQISTTVIFLQVFDEYKTTIKEQQDCKDVINEANAFWIDLTDAVLSRFSRKVLGRHNSSRDYDLMDDYEKRYKEVHDDAARYGKAELFEEIKRRSDTSLAIIDEFVQGQDMVKSENMDGFAMLTGKVKTFVAFERLFAEMNEGIREFNQSWVNETAEDARKVREKGAGVVITALVTIASSFVLTLILVMIFQRGFEYNFRTILQNTKRLAESKPLLPPLTSGDELGYLDKTFHDMAKALHKAEQAKQDFFDMISHDMRTPLSSIMMTSEMLASRTDLSPDVSNAIVRTQRNALKLMNLINDLLDIDKLESGEMHLQCQSEFADGLFKEAKEMVAPIADRKKIKLVVPDTDLQLHCDRERILRVLVNLLSNAIKFSENNSSIEMDIMINRGMVEVSVQDHGQGIALEHQAFVFDRFKQVSIDDNSKKGGSGLGLAICKGLVEAHGGSIGLESSPGNGCRFWFRLPLVDQEPAMMEVQTSVH